MYENDNDDAADADRVRAEEQGIRPVDDRGTSVLEPDDHDKLNDLLSQDGHVFERVAPKGAGYPQPGDRYRTSDTRGAGTLLVAAGPVLGSARCIERLDALHNPALWRRADL